MPGPRVDESILAIDIGATSIKVGLVDESGSICGSVARISTPYPCSPSELVTVIVKEITCSRCTRVGVGFPGEFWEGVVIEPGNLSRPGGILSDVDPGLHEMWLNFKLQEALRAGSGADVRVVNDATMAALGCSKGHGRELVFTLGTAFGIALVVDGSPARIRDVGAEVFIEGRTYDEVLGEPSRDNDERRWLSNLKRAVCEFIAEFDADVVHFGGGNAGRVDLGMFGDVDCRFVVNDNNAAIRGAGRLFA